MVFIKQEKFDYDELVFEGNFKNLNLMMNFI